MRKIRISVSVLLAMSAILLAVMVPGGPIESRNFSHISPVVLGAFNTFLTSLGLLSFPLIYLVLRQRRGAYFASALFGLLYLTVYVLDLDRIFPVSPVAMPRALFILEVLGSIISLPLIFFAVHVRRSTVSEEAVERGQRRSRKWGLLLVVGLVVIAIAIITFATNAAMHG